MNIRGSYFDRPVIIILLPKMAVVLLPKNNRLQHKGRRRLDYWHPDYLGKRVTIPMLPQQMTLVGGP